MEETEESKLTLFFAKDRLSAAPPIRANSIYLWPASKWNDFSKRVIFDACFYPREGESYSFRLFLGFQHLDESPSEKVSAILEEENKTLLAAKSFPPIFTMLPAMENYRDLVDKLKQKTAIDLLRALNDVVLARSEESPPWFHDAIRSLIFKRAFVRDVSAFFTYHNAIDVLRELEVTASSKLSENYHLRFKLDSFSNAHELSFGFHHGSLLPERIAIVIGKNGVGKSQALAHIAKALLKGNEPQDEEDEVENGTIFTDAEGGRPLVNRLIAIAAPGLTGKTFPRKRPTDQIQYHRVILGHGARFQDVSSVSESLTQLARSTQKLGDTTRQELFLSTVSPILPLEDIFVEIEFDGGLTTYGEQKEVCVADLFENLKEMHKLDLLGSIKQQSEVFRLKNGKRANLSSGQDSFLRFAAHLSLHIETASLVLVDEPETHLHPNLISVFVALLDRFLEVTGSFAVIATHSVYLAREVPETQVNVLVEGEDRTVGVTSPRFRTLGADIGAISQFVFNDEIHSSLIERLKKKLDAIPNQKAKELEQMKMHLSPEAIMFLQEDAEVELE